MIDNINNKAQMMMGIKVLMDDAVVDDRLLIQFYNDNHRRQHVFMLGERFQISKTRVGPALSTATEHGPAMAEQPL